jgi:hypothetical protein
MVRRRFRVKQRSGEVKLAEHTGGKRREEYR